MSIRNHGQPAERLAVHRWLLVAATGACVVLLLRGPVGLTLLGASVLSGTFDQRTPLVLIAIEPWFVLSGLAFGGMVLQTLGST